MSDRVVSDGRQNKIKDQGYHNAKATEGSIIVEDSKKCNGRKRDKIISRMFVATKKVTTVIRQQEKYDNDKFCFQNFSCSPSLFY